MANGTDAGPLWQRILWLVAIWAMGLVAVSAVATVIRFWLT